MRSFTSQPGKRSATPCLVGITGASSSGKTYSALRLAVGMQRVVGGSLFFIDTEHRRALHYADRFQFQHVDFQAPFGPLDYLAAIEHCVAQGAKTIIVDSMTHEHSSAGGVMDQSEKYLDAKAGDDEAKRRKLFMSSLIKPKSERKKLNTAIVHLGVNAVFCYRAQEKIKPRSGGEPEQLGWQPETTSPLHYEMMVRFLLEPGSDGRPSVAPEHAAERLATKLPIQFRDWLKPGTQLDEDLGEKLARWCAGPEAPAVDIVAAWATMTDDAKRAAWRTATAEQKAAIQALKRAGQEEPGANG